MAYSVVQSNNAYDGGAGGPTISKAFTSNNTAGNALVAFLAVYGTVGPSSFGDTNGNTWVLLRSDAWAASSFLFNVYYCLSCSAGPNTIQGSFGGSTFWEMTFAEISATAGQLWHIDASNFLDGTASSPVSVAVTTINASDILLSMLVLQPGGMVITGNWTLKTTDGYDGILQSTIVSSAGSQTSSGTYSGSPNNKAASVVAFYAAAPAPPAVTAGSVLPVYKAIGIF